MSSSSSLSSLSSSSSSSLPYVPVRRRGVILRRWQQTRFLPGMTDGWRFRVTAYGAYGMPREIFRYLRRPYDPLRNTQVDEFDGVCSPVDLEEYPVYAPTGVPPFFRHYFVDLVFRSQAEAEEAWRLLQQEVQNLVLALNYMDELRYAEDYVCGNPPPAVFSSSSGP